MTEDQYDQEFQQQEISPSNRHKQNLKTEAQALNPQQITSKHKSEGRFKSLQLFMNKKRNDSITNLQNKRADPYQAELTEEQLMRRNIKLHLRIKSYVKQLQEKKNLRQSSVLEIKQPPKPSLTSRPLKREFSVEALNKHLHSQINKGKQTLESQQLIILKLQNRLLELQSEKYLVEIAKKCQEYKKDIKRIKKIVQNQTEWFQQKPRGVTEKQHQVSIMTKYMYTELQIEKMKQKETDLDERLVQAERKNKQLEEKLNNLGSEKVQMKKQPITSNQILEKQYRGQIVVEKKYVKIAKSNFKNKIKILSKQNEEIQQQIRKIDQQFDRQNITNHQVLERLKNHLGDVKDEQVLQLGKNLQQRLQKFPKINLQSNKNVTYYNDNKFVKGIIKLKRKVAALAQSKHDKTSIQVHKATESPSLASMFPSISPSTKNLTLPRNHKSQRSLTLVDDKHAFARFSYW